MKPLKKTSLMFGMGFFLFAACKFVAAENTKNITTPALKTVGGSKLQFTDSRVIPPEADTYFPFTAIGKLWFTKSNGSAGTCTGSVIAPGIVVTAGHCVHSGNGANSGWSYNYRFAPAYRNGVAPHGIWTKKVYHNTPSEWYYGGGKLPHPTDYAVIVFDKDRLGKRIGDLTGWLSWYWEDMIGHQVTVFGYANNLDKGAINHRVDSYVTPGTNNTGVFGSNMAAGSDGGPVIVNFGEPAAGGPRSWDGRDVVVSVVSYTSKASLMKQGGSQFDSRFKTLLENTCKLYPWACTK